MDRAAEHRVEEVARHGGPGRQRRPGTTAEQKQVSRWQPGRATGPGRAAAPLATPLVSPRCASHPPRAVHVTVRTARTGRTYHPSKHDAGDTGDTHRGFEDTIMQSKSLMSALALALTVAATAGAQGVGRQDHPARPDRAQQDTTVRRGMRGQRGPEMMLLRGITLSEAQRQQLVELREQARKEWEANRPRRQDGQGPDASAPRPRRERGDTAAMAARRAQMEQRFEQRIAAIRGILTAEQRTQFDRNVAELKTHRFGERRGR
jgi:Spy/CpxP family protein refolding chaperone